MVELVGSILLNRYHVLEKLGGGGMAEVYKVWDTQKVTHLALKLLREDLAQDMVFLRRFRREAQTLAKLQHPNIVRFYDLEQDDLLAFILMDYVDGVSLRGEIFRGRGKGALAKGRIMEIMRPVCSALQYAHNMGMVHCDMKPANIMLEKGGRVLVADFGIARMSDAATSTMVGAGTPAYMAPEQVRGLDAIPQTDIYALGISLYEMLTGGERPFTGDHAETSGSTSEKVLWEQIRLEPPSPRRYNQGITPQLEAVVMRCLAKEPGQRYGSVLELLNALELAMREAGVPRVEPDAGYRPAPGERQELRPAAPASPSLRAAASSPSPLRGEGAGGEVLRRPKRSLLLLGIGGIAVMVVVGVMLMAGMGRVSPGQHEVEALALLATETATLTPTHTQTPTKTVTATSEETATPMFTLTSTATKTRPSESPTPIKTRVPMSATIYPALTSTLFQTKTDWKVTAITGWFPTGITITKGQTVTITASGIANLWGGTPSSNNIPNGKDGGELCASKGCLMRGITYGTLIGRLGDEIFRVGSYLKFVASTNGKLFLGINDDYSADNLGAYSVTITIK